MTLVSRIIAGLALTLMLGGCATGQPRNWVDASAWSANYTEDYIYDFSIQTADGKDTGVVGVQVKEFARGGTGKRECCGLMPGVGQTVKVVWRVGGRQEDESQWKTYSKNTVITGTTSNNPNAMNFVIIRFFPDHNVEAEFVAESMRHDGKPSLRVDQLFYGRRIMREKGE